MRGAQVLLSPTAVCAIVSRKTEMMQKGLEGIKDIVRDLV